MGSIELPPNAGSRILAEASRTALSEDRLRVLLEDLRSGKYHHQASAEWVLDQLRAAPAAMKKKLGLTDQEILGLLREVVKLPR